MVVVAIVSKDGRNMVHKYFSDVEQAEKHHDFFHDNDDDRNIDDVQQEQGITKNF